MNIFDLFINIFESDSIFLPEDILYLQRISDSHGSDHVIKTLIETFKQCNFLHFSSYVFETKFLTLQTQCFYCKSYKHIDINLLDMQWLLLDMFYPLCLSCEHQHTKNSLLEDTYLYIEKFLNKCISFSNKYYTVLIMNELLNKNVNSEAIAKHIKNMRYADFLHTPYWKAISYREMKKANFKCSYCKSYELLDTHHLTYSNHGYELNHPEDLVVLCRNCHERAHDKKFN